uniref:Uncharacterized protein n=1 Tax=Plectus sambesii TaxID=2011161 RepID=A0A914XJR2_9BILA
MKLLVLLPYIACLVSMSGAQDPTDQPTEAPEITLSPETPTDPESTIDFSSFSTETSELTTTVLPDSTSSSITDEPSSTDFSTMTSEAPVETTADPESTTDSSTFSTETSELTTTVLPDFTSSSITDEPSSTDFSTMTSEAPVETTAAVNETIDGNSTVCKDVAPAVCKSFAKLCQAPKHCGGKKSGSHEKSQEGNKKDEKSKEELKQLSELTEGVESDDDNDDAICAWVRMQPQPKLLEISAKCHQENVATRLQFVRNGLFGGPRGPKLPTKPRGSQKQLDCRLQKVASVSFQLLCPATCNAC